MKNKMILGAITLLLALQGLWAQPGKNAPRLKERMAEAQWREIRRELALDDKRTREIKPLYLRYTDELSQVGFRSQRNLLQVDPDLISREEAQDAIQRHFEDSEQQLLIRKKYYAEFSKVMSPNEIIRLHQTEAEVRQKVMKEMRRRRQNRQ
jgi:hypothetical protein